MGSDGWITPLVRRNRMFEVDLWIEAKKESASVFNRQ